MSNPLLLPAPTAPSGAQRVLEALAVREDVERTLLALFDELSLAVPSLRPHRAFSDGAWVLGVHTGGRRGESLLDFSRLDVELHLEDRVRLVARTTIRDRDHDAEALAVTWDEAGRAEGTAFLEQACLGFAEAYWTRD